MLFFKPIAGAGLYLMAAVTLDKDSLVPIGTAAVIGLGLFWSGARYQKILDRLKNIENRLNGLPCTKCPTPKEEEEDTGGHYA